MGIITFDVIIALPDFGSASYKGLNNTFALSRSLCNCSNSNTLLDKLGCSPKLNNSYNAYLLAKLPSNAWGEKHSSALTC